MLRVGDESGLRPLISEQLGDIPLVRGIGHDGQYYYAIGLDILGEEVPAFFEDSGFRYRRILSPVAGSVFGLLSGWPLLYGLAAVAAVSMGVATGAMAVIASKLGMSQLAALAVLLNPGMLLSVHLLTGDALAMAMMTLGLLALISRSSIRLPAALFSLSTLSKDAFLVTPVGLGLGRDRSRWLLIALPVVSLGLWICWITFRMGGGLTGEGNFGLPFRGTIESFGGFATLGAEERFYLVFAFGLVIAGLALAIVRRSWLRWALLLWALVGVFSSSMVWESGNNAARVFAPILVLAVLSLREPVPPASVGELVRS